MLLGIQAGEISQTIGLAIADGDTGGDVRDALPVHPTVTRRLPTCRDRLQPWAMAA